MKQVLAISMCCLAAHAFAATSEPPCGTLAGPSGSFELRTGAPVNFVGAGKTVPGTLHVFRDGAVWRIYWQPSGQPSGQLSNSPDQYALANAGPNRVRLIDTPPQGSPASRGPATTMPPQQVLSCPVF